MVSPAQHAVERIESYQIATVTGLSASQQFVLVYDRAQQGMCTEEGTCDHLRSCLGGFIGLGLSLSIAGISIALCLAGTGLPLLNRLLQLCPAGILHLQFHATPGTGAEKRKLFNASHLGKRGGLLENLPRFKTLVTDP